MLRLNGHYSPPEDMISYYKCNKTRPINRTKIFLETSRGGCFAVMILSHRSRAKITSIPKQTTNLSISSSTKKN